MLISQFLIETRIGFNKASALKHTIKNIKVKGKRFLGNSSKFRKAYPL